ncbi:GGDEF domain-containing protein [Alicyclobacillus dauci]|uniref:GGDEF domain-containing protein n=1 Tax=Alicyclobacillus dauci TaxID=1475485 RepID=A0ABY6Z135_9BACL|nr:GGDEF domain-containing protein [Alicyclobacillus dauci]WAH36557.1 GGDEF domain-containing protein [Alicyclobacillus dauci]
MQNSASLMAPKLRMTTLIAIVGNVLLVGCLWTTISTGRPQLVLFICLTCIFLAVARLSVVLPSGAGWRPGVPIVTMSIFVLPPAIAAVVCLPGVLLMVGRKGGWWRQFLKTSAHMGITLFVGAGAYRALLHLLDSQRFDALLFCAVIALACDLGINRAIASVYVAEREGRALGRQFSLTFRELHLGYPTAYLLSFMTAILAESEGVLALFLGTCLQLAVFQSIAIYTKMSSWQRTALTDGLTKLGNRLAWDSFTQSFLTESADGSIAVIDLDKLKEINDTYGHMMGDMVLSDLGVYLQQDLPPFTRTFRYGGDEFVVFYPHETVEREQVCVRLERLLEAFSNEWRKKGIDVGYSMGIAVCPIDSRDITELFHLADSKMYKEKFEHKALNCGTR